MTPPIEEAIDRLVFRVPRRAVNHRFDSKIARGSRKDPGAGFKAMVDVFHAKEPALVIFFDFGFYVDCDEYSIVSMLQTIMDQTIPVLPSGSPDPLVMPSVSTLRRRRDSSPSVILPSTTRSSSTGAFRKRHRQRGMHHGFDHSFKMSEKNSCGRGDESQGRRDHRSRR